MNLDELRTVQSKERRKDSLQQLRDSFYRDVASFIQDLKATRDRRAEQVDDPFSDTEVRRLSDELETAEEVAEAVYERRVGKVVKLASFAAADMPVDDDGMTSEERELFDDLVARITQNKQAVLDVLSGTAETTKTTDTEPATAGPTNPVETESQQEATATGQQPTASQTNQPPASQTNQPPASQTDQPPASTRPDGESVLAEAMGAETESSPETATSGPDPNTEADATEPSTSADVPPTGGDPEPETVLGTSTDGGTTDSVEPVHNGTAQPEPAGPVDTTPKPAMTAADTPEPATAITENNPADDDNDRTTVRITKNVGDIFCVDGREYTLCSEDVVTLPTANAEPLVERDAAQPLD